MSDPLRQQLTDRLADLACTLTYGQTEALALELEGHRSPSKIRQVGGLPAPKVVAEVCDLWQRVSVEGQYLADALRCAASAVRTTTDYEKVELLYTGPSSDSIRRTKQALLEVVRSARKSLWIVSYVITTGVDDVLAALGERVQGGVDVRVLLDHTPPNATWGFQRLATSAPGSNVFIWPDEARQLKTGVASLHAKCAVADGRLAFVSSANLTGHAMDHNLEVGYLVTGGASPRALSRYLDRLVDEEVLVLFTGSR